MKEEFLLFTIKENDTNIKAITLEDIDLFVTCELPTEKEFEIIYSYGFILKKIIPKDNYNKYIFIKFFEEI